MELVPVGDHTFDQTHHIQFLLDNFVSWTNKISFKEQTGSQVF